MSLPLPFSSFLFFVCVCCFQCLQETYGFALVDGYKEKVGNFRVEPPNLFRGRGDHPKTGTLKRRVKPEDIIINISQGMPIPKPPTGTKWKGIIHNNRVTWLAFYKDNVNGDFKYIWLVGRHTITRTRHDTIPTSCIFDNADVSLTPFLCVPLFLLCFVSFFLFFLSSFRLLPHVSKVRVISRNIRRHKS